MSPQRQSSFSVFPSPDSSRPPPATSPRQARCAHAQTPQQRADTPVESDPPRRGAPSVDRPCHVLQASPSRSGAPGAAGQQPGLAAGLQDGLQDDLQDDTLLRGTSGRSRGSIDNGHLPPSSAPHPLRSIFPTYNPDLPLDQQEYAPTLVGPCRIPRAAISRQSYHTEPLSPQAQSVWVRSPVRRPRGPPPSGPWPVRQQSLGPADAPKPCTTDQLKGLWKAANGWKASASEGRVYRLSLVQLKDAPVYTLSSASSHPFYRLRLDPTSASAYVTLTRHDPCRPYKAPKPDGSSSPGSTSSGSRASDTRNWHEALTTTLEEESRKHPPNDGLIALLMPSPATKMALEKAGDPVAVMQAETECARLIWDSDTAAHFLVHPALAAPFHITVERCPAYSRTEYTLEHLESPKHLARLTRDGTGGGWIELDTGVASKIESFFIIDVAVAALILVASADDRDSPISREAFEPPPPALPADHGKHRSGKLSTLSVRHEDRKKRRMREDFDIDVESQDGSLAKDGKGREDQDKLPLVLRVVVKVARGLFKYVVWMLAVALKCAAGLFKLMYKCVGSK